MTVEDWVKSRPDVSVEQVVEELIEWRERASEYKKLWYNEQQVTAKLRYDSKQ